MLNIFVQALHRIGIAFGLSLALVSAVAAQTADLTDGPQIADPTSGAYGLRLGLYNFGTSVGGIFRGSDWKEDRHLRLNDDYVRQCNKVKGNEVVLERVLARKAQHDQFLEQIAAADPTFKDEVAREFASQRGAFLSIKNAASGAAINYIDGALDRVAIAEANFTEKKGLPPDAEAQLKSMGISDDEITKIKQAADQNWAQGYQAFKQLMAKNPDLARLMESGFHRADFEFHGAREFGGLPPEALEHFRNAEQFAGVQFLSNPEFVGKYKDFAGSAAKNFKFDFDDPAKQAEFKKFLPADQFERFNNFGKEIRARFGDPSKINPEDFHKFTQEFEGKHGPPPEGLRGGFRGGEFKGGSECEKLDYPARAECFKRLGGERGGFKGGPFPEPKPGEGQPTSPAPNYTPPSNGQFSPTYSPTPSQTYSPTSSPTYSPTYTPTSSPTYSPTPSPTHSPTYTYTPPTSCPSGYTGTYPNCVRQ